MGKASLIATAICLTLLRTTSSFSSMQPRAAVAATTRRQRGPFAGGFIQSTTCRRSERSRLRMSDAAAAPKKGFVEKVRWKSNGGCSVPDQWSIEIRAIVHHDAVAD